MRSNAIGYIRVSTDGQVTDGVSLDAQRAKIEAWCDLNDYPLKAVHMDAGISGKSAANRPGLQDALKDCGQGDALVVYSLSRLSRSIRDTLDISDSLAKTGADLVSLSEKIDTTSAAGKMVFRMMAVLAEFERDQISERTTTALSYKKSVGEKTGGAAPYGYAVEIERSASKERKLLIVSCEEQAAIAKARELHAAGLSQRKIAKELLACGFTSRNNKMFVPTQIQRMIK